MKKGGSGRTKNGDEGRNKNGKERGKEGRMTLENGGNGRGR